ncbi:MAG: helix-turn-helix transcriptional regulator [Acutalibacteraceae bacterium]|nr:helix-turn-helix transcriptional regulator [Acutalibacteraceae bacterium]
MNTDKKGFLERVNIKEKDYKEAEKKICTENLIAFYNACNTDEGIKNNILGSRIKHIRKLNNIKITTLAEKSSIDRSTIYRIEQGKNKRLPWLDTISKIVAALDFDMNDFVRLPDDNKTWLRIHRHLNKSLCDDAFEEVKLTKSCEINNIKAEFFKKLDYDYVYYEENGKNIIVPENYVELLRMNIYNAFETFEYVLKNT